MKFQNINIGTLEYVALSYVWGTVQRLFLKRDNSIELGTSGSLVGRVSQTIANAITVTKRLGIRYLWADALCILQDQASDKMVNLAFMSDMYEAAALTIIAASGRDVAAGLPGVFEEREFRQHAMKVKDELENTPALHIMASPSKTPDVSLSYLDNSVWSTRG